MALLLTLRQVNRKLVRGVVLAFQPAATLAPGGTSSFTALIPANPPITTSISTPLDHAGTSWRPSASRAYHNLVGELDHLAWSRRGLFAELPVVSEMLPNRKLLQAQHVSWSPHGLTCVPKAIVAASTSPPVAAVQEPTDPIQQTPMQAIGIKTWRRLKMKKHKIRKRRKEARMQAKKN